MMKAKMKRRIEKLEAKVAVLQDELHDHEDAYAEHLEMHHGYTKRTETTQAGDTSVIVETFEPKLKAVKDGS